MDTLGVDSDYERGLYFYQLGQFQAAESHLDRFLAQSTHSSFRENAFYYLTLSQAERDSFNVEVYVNRFAERFPASEKTPALFTEIGHRLSRAGWHDDAIFYYEQVLATTPFYGDAAEAQYWIAEEFVAQDKFTEAKNAFARVADEFPDSEWAPKALYSKGRLQLNAQQYSQATQTFEALRKAYPNHPVTRRVGTALGESYYQQKRYKEAAEALLNAQPYVQGEQLSKAVYLIAESYNVLGQLDDAANYYRRYINLNKNRDVRFANYGLGWVYHKQGIYHWSAGEFEKAAAKDDDLSRKALYYKAINEKLAGRYAESLATFEAFGRQYKQGFWIETAYYEWAIIAFEYGDYPSSINILQDLLRSGTSLQEPGKVLTFLGEAYFANKEYTRSLQAFEEAEKSRQIPEETKRQARFQRAWVMYENQAFEQAQPIFFQVFNEAPNTDLGAEALFWSADSYYSIEEFGPAGKQFGEFISRYPNHEFVGAARYSKGWADFKMRQYASAAGSFEAFLSDYQPPPIALFPYDIDARLRLGDAYYALGRYEKAIQEYEKGIGAEPGGDYALFQIGNSYYRMDKSYEAVTTFRRMVRIYPFSRLREQAQYNIAYVYFLIGNYDQAIAEFKTVIDKYKSTKWAARSQYNIGDAHYNAGQYAQAMEAYSAVLKNHPRSDYIIDAVNGIQFSQLAAGLSDSSSVVLEEFLSKNPRSTTADRLRFRKAESLLQSGDYAGSIASFEEYIRITNVERMIPEAYYNLADAHIQLGQDSLAVDAYNEIVERYPKSERYESSLLNKARLLKNKGDLSRAYESYQTLYDSHGQFTQEALVGMGEIRLLQNNTTEAQQFFEQAMQASKNRDAPQLGLGKVYLQEQQYERAISEFETVANRNVSNTGAEAQYLLGVALQRKGDYRKAADAFLNVQTLFEAYTNWVSKALLGAGESKIIIGERGEGRGILQSLIQNYPNTPEAQRAQSIIDG